MFKEALEGQHAHVNSTKFVRERVCVRMRASARVQACSVRFCVIVLPIPNRMFSRAVVDERPRTRALLHPHEQVHQKFAHEHDDQWLHVRSGTLFFPILFMNVCVRVYVQREMYIYIRQIQMCMKYTHDCAYIPNVHMHRLHTI
jgi:hypothetical protein